MRTPRSVLLALLLPAAVIAGCAGAGPTPTPTPVVDATACGPEQAAYPDWPSLGAVPPAGAFIPIPNVSADTAIGPNRLLFALVDPKNQSIAAASVTTKLRFFAVQRDPATPTSTTTGEFVDAGGGRGLYHASVDFTCAGDWGMEVTAQLPSGTASARVIFPVRAVGTTPAIGAPAPGLNTPTATTAAGIAAISTDPTPDPDFYRMTIAQAVGAGKPAMIVFATPTFCQSAMCGPTLQGIKDVAADYKATVNFVHVEPYLLQQTPNGLQLVLSKQGQLQTVPATDAYGLQSEPFSFVLDRNGKVAAKFDGIIGADELRAALDAVIGG